ncbi:hypothetical protein VTN31DRAFT_7209 [Thermomyces dupontii]|uniref:uncharacterized protein n=1 Tax=Talaromyces thermophilus TaxID=28565 RepID=UPI003744226D
MAYGMIAVSAADLHRAERFEDLATAAQFPPGVLDLQVSTNRQEDENQDREEEDKYIAVAMGTHQLHCLHFIWQDHYARYFPNTTLRKQKEVPELYELHYEHCIDVIRQTIMCDFDTTLLSYDWVADHHVPTPNTNVMHKCIDWDALQAWLRERAVPMPEGFVWGKPQGQQSLDYNP